MVTRSDLCETFAGVYPRHRIAQLQAEGEPLLGALKAAIGDADAALDERFRSGACIRELVRSRAWLIDQVLGDAWDQFEWAGAADIALMAVGGYGRGELHPHSDIDLLILLSSEQAMHHGPQMEAFLTFLWDLGLKVGHAVRNLEECVQRAEVDITIATNLMESRCLRGNPDLVSQLQARTGADQIWPTKQFFRAKWNEQKQRHHKYNDTEYNLEPNIKGSPGGLRDIQTIGWVAKRHFGADSFQDLVELGFISTQEYESLQSCQDLLWRVRYALHMLTGRPEDRLLFDHQRAIAELFGLHDSDESLAVEKLMKDYYRAVEEVGQINELLLQHFDEAILGAGENEIIEPCNERFQLRNNYLEAISQSVFRTHPFAIMELFVLLARQPDAVGVRAETIRLLRASRPLVNDRFRNDPICTALFLDLMRSARPATELQRMQRYGILGEYLPAFGRIIGQMQYDLFHIYTVDAHTLRVIRNMQLLNEAEGSDIFPGASEIMQNLPKPELLYLAGLYHDIAKGRGGDHSKLGVEDVIAFCTQHHLSEWDAGLLSWLVREHLIMSTTAQRKDLSDPAVIHDFATVVGDQVHLDYLYALTICDIRATNPTLWNGWRAALLRHLYDQTTRLLRRGLEQPVDRNEWIKDTQTRALSMLAESGVSADQAHAFWEDLGDEYFMQCKPEDIAWHTREILAHEQHYRPLVLLQDMDVGGSIGGTKIFIYTPDQANLFAATAAALDQLHLSIHDARILTSQNNFSLDTYVVLEEDGSPIGDKPERIREIGASLEEALADPDCYPAVVQRHTPRQLKHFEVATEVTFSNNPVSRITVMALVTSDQPGLLARVGRVFLEFEVSLQKAKISTLGERVEDVFFVTDRQQQPLSDPQLCAHLADRLKEVLDGNRGVTETHP